jgi:hypothetical protein
MKFSSLLESEHSPIVIPAIAIFAQVCCILASINFGYRIARDWFYYCVVAPIEWGGVCMPILGGPRSGYLDNSVAKEKLDRERGFSYERDIFLRLDLSRRSMFERPVRYVTS